MFENSQVVKQDEDVNDLAESSWKEIQRAFGSSTSLGGDVSIPITGIISADAGGKKVSMDSDMLGNARKNQQYIKNIQK